MAITAQEIVDRIQRKLGPGWKDPSVDTFLAGNRHSEVKGVVTTFAPSLEVLRKAVAGGKNMIIGRESPFWARAAAQARPGTGGPGPTQPFRGRRRENAKLHPVCSAPGYASIGLVQNTGQVSSRRLIHRSPEPLRQRSPVSSRGLGRPDEPLQVPCFGLGVGNVVKVEIRVRRM